MSRKISGGTKFDRWVEQARFLGLVVVVEDHSEGILQSIVATITRPRVEPPMNMLDVYRNSQTIRLHAVRTFNEGKWNNHASYTSSGTNGLEALTVRRVQYRISGMAE